MKFPYGIADFRAIREEGYLYIDRTDRIPLMEEIGKQVLFLRPRRFGKSLWLSTLENYYDLARRDRFDALFGGLKIGQDPTPRHNSYVVMVWDFSTVDTQGDVDYIRGTLYRHINRLAPVDNSLIFINFMNRLRAKRTDSLTNRFFLLSIRPV